MARRRHDLLRLGLRTRLFLSVLLLVGFFATTSGWWLSGQLRQILLDDVEAHLSSHARTLARVVPAGADRAAIARATDHFSAGTGTRVTVIAMDGLVFADSEADARVMDNHGGRSEVVAARESGYGMSVRFSDTVKRDMLYVAVPWPAERPIGVVRVSRPLTEVEANVNRLSRVVWVAGFGGLVVTLLLAAGFSQVVTRDLRRLTVRARQLARGRGAGPVDEIAWLSGSIDRLATELRHAVDDVAEERNRLHAVLAGLGEAVVAVDGQGIVELTNPAARDLLGSEGAMVGVRLIEAVGSPVLVELVDGVLESGISDSADIRWADAVDPTRVRELMVTVTPHAGGGAVLVLADVSELRRLEAVRRDFVANVSHELRTPVAVIQSSAEALQGGAVLDPNHGPGFVDAIARHAERLGALISDLLDLAKIESGRQGLAVDDLNLRAAVAEALDPLIAPAEAGQKEIEVDVPNALRVRADPVALQQIVVNLVENAVKYTPAGAQIEVAAREWDDHVELSVTDDGPGIAGHHHDRVFERFYRVDPGRSRDMGGTGLGLSIVRHLIEVQGGSIRLEHASPRGARFVVQLQKARTGIA